LFDYFNFFKTRAVLDFVAKRRNFISLVFGMLVEMGLLLFLSVISIFINIELNYLFFGEDMDKFQKSFPSGLLGIIINSISATLSTILVILFTIATFVSYGANNISVIQQFLDNHTAVLEKPLQILGVMLVFIFAVLFWTPFGLYRLYTAVL